MTTRRTVLKTGVAGVFALAAGGVASGAVADDTGLVAALDPAALQAALDEFAATAASGVLAEVRDVRCSWRGTSGVAELGSTRPVPVNGRFRIGSTTKSFVATVVLQLVGERRVALDQPVRRWLPDIDDRITLRHLLQHTSGLVNYTNTREFRDLYGTVEDIVALRDRTWTPQELLAFTTGQPALFEPGGSWTYSNTNYILLALVVERVTGNHYAAEIARRILRPLSLRATELPGTNPRITGPHSHGYLPREHDGSYEPVDITVFNPTVTGASGEMLSTTTDLNRFYRALMTGRLLPPAQLDQMRTVWPTGRRYDYGLGLQTRQLADGTRLWGHEGEIFGYFASSWSTEDGSRQLTVAVNPWGEGDLNKLIDSLQVEVFRQS